ncbi:MAG TPA: hypothetical protein PLO37_05265 [Candidatus Hydrogenedentes bacterium]|nr:hypothetical protein [Candidatus Hydrogenedentota bacterium]HPG66235.1 hypothetical protein [Candidatus Hydrogenedentota bacterium]
MPIKYHCPRCGRKYVEWGAEKLGFRCPDCDAALDRVGGGPEKGGDRPSLRRHAVAKPVPRSGPVGSGIEGFEEGEELIDDAANMEALGGDDDDIVEETDGIVVEPGDRGDGPVELDFGDEGSHESAPEGAEEI